MKLEDLKIEDETLLENIKKVIASSEDRVRTDYKKKYADYETIKKENDDFKAEKEKAKKIESAKKALKNKELPEELANYIVLEGDEFDTYLDDIAKVLNSHYKNADNSFKPKNHVSDKITREQFNKMDYFQRENLLNTNPTLYNSLVNQK